MLATRQWILAGGSRGIARSTAARVQAMVREPFGKDRFPDFEPLRTDADDGFELAGVGFEFHGQEQEPLHDRAGAFGQVFLGEDEELHRAEQVVGDGAEGIPGVVGSKAVTGWAMQSHVAENFAKSTFAFAFETMAFKGGLGLGGGGAAVFFNFDVAVLPEHVVFSFVAQDGVEAGAGAALGLVFDPVVGDEVFLSSSPVFEGGLAPGVFGEPGCGPVQWGGPFVIADAVPGEVILGVMEVVTGAGATVGIEVMFACFAEMGAVLAEGGEASADVALAAELAFEDEGASPEGLPTEGAVAVVVDGGLFEFFAGDFDLGVVKEPFFFGGSVAVFFLGALVEDPGAETAVEIFESVAARLIERAEPFTKGALIGDFFEAEEFEESFVGAEFLDVGQAGSAGAAADDGGDHVDFRIEAPLGVFAMVEFGVFRDPVHKTRLPKNPDEGELAAMHGAGLRAAEFDLKFAGLQRIVPGHDAFYYPNTVYQAITQNHPEGEAFPGSLMIREGQPEKITKETCAGIFYDKKHPIFTDN